LLAGVLVLAAAGQPPRARAQSQEAALPTYVSAKFKAVARRAFTELLAAELARSCPQEKEQFCTVVVARAGDALDASLRGDDAALRDALNGLFVDASVHGFLAGLIGDLVQAEDREIRGALAPVTRCLAAAIGDRPLRGACELEQPAEEYAEALFRALGADPKKGNVDAVPRYFAALASTRAVDPALAEEALRTAGFKGRDVAKVSEFLSILFASRRVDPSLASDALAAIAVLERVGRPDLRVYLLRLKEVREQGLDQGLFEAGMRFLTANLRSDSADGYTVSALANYLEDRQANRLWGGDSAQEDAWRRAIERCGQKPAALDAWIARRDPYLKVLRRGAILGRRVDYGPLDALLGYHDHCKDEDARQIRGLKRQVWYFLGPLRSYEALYRFGAPGLALAALFDYVRSQDEARLERNLKRTALYAVAQLGVQRRNIELLGLENEADPATWVTTEKLAWVGESLRSCELRVLSASLDAPLPAAPSRLHGADGADGRCRSIVSGELQDAPSLASRPANVALASWVGQNRQGIVTALSPLLTYATVEATQRGVFAEADALAISRAVQYFADGDAALGRRTMVRLGVDLLAANLDTFVGGITGASEASCLADYRTRTIFSPVQAGCAAHLLVVSAYRPVADYYWGAGGGRQTPDQVATAVYGELLESAVLDYTPIILNLGLGGTWVGGRATDWGRDGYGALTVLDKIGVAFVKTSSARTRFEAGLFVGGFLDAIVRTAAEVGKAERYWLTGVTAGWPRLGGVNIGLELHAGAAMPFQFGSGARYGFAAGGAVVVPFNWLFAEGGK
jgi:hypothetical protein